MTQCQVTVAIPEATLTALSESGSVLQVLRAVRSSDHAARPLLWMTPSYTPQTEITWTDGYLAYTSASPIRAGQAVRAGFAVPIQPGQLLSVRAGGFGEVTWSRYPDQVTVLNTTQTACTCGIATGADAVPEPFCAVPLYGGNLQFVAPVPRILLRFSSWPLAKGAVIDDSFAMRTMSFGPGVLVDLTGTTQRALRYDINAGWSWGGQTWARQIHAGEPLAPLLIEQPVVPLKLSYRA